MDDLENLTNQQNALMDKQQQGQNNIINQQTQMQVDEMNRAKEKLDKETQKTTSGLYTDYAKQVNQYGAGMEQLQDSGLANSGYAETTRTALYNNYQRGVTDTLNKSNELKADYDFKIQQARQNGSIQQAQSALQLYAQRLQLLTQNYQLRYQRKQDELQQSNWQKQYDQQVRQNELENSWRNQQFEYQKGRDAQADRQWQMQYDLQKKNLARGSSKGRSRKSTSKGSNEKLTVGSGEGEKVKSISEMDKDERFKKAVANMEIYAGPNLEKNIGDKETGERYSNPYELLNKYGIAVMK